MSRVFCRADGYTCTLLAEAARDHLRAALILFRSSPLFFDSAGYLAHLSIELLFKTLLLDILDEFPDEHDLAKLQSRMQEAIPEFELTEAGWRVLNLVNKFKDLRYPRPNDPIEIGDDDVDDIVNLYNSLWTYIPEEDRPKLGNAEGFVEKGGRILMKKRRDTESDRP